MLKISRLLLLKDFGKKISKFQENWMCLWNTDASGHNKVHMRANTAHVMSIQYYFIFTIATRLFYHVVELNFDKRFWHNMGFFTLENKQWNTFSMSNWSHDLKHRGRSSFLHFYARFTSISYNLYQLINLNSYYLLKSDPCILMIFFYVLFNFMKYRTVIWTGIDQ